MRLGISAALQHSTPEEWAKKHAELGLTAVVFPVNYLAGEDVIEAYAAAAHAYGLVIAEVGVWKNVIAVEEAERREAVAYAIGQLRMADRIGARCCVNIAGAAAGARWDGPCAENYSKDAWDRTVQSVREIVDAAKPVRTKYSLEPMPWMIPDGPEAYVKLLQDIDREAVAVHMDLINMINCPERYFSQEAFIERCFSMLGDKICSCHLKDVHLRSEFTFMLEECALGQGELNVEAYIEAAGKVDLEMPMLIEHLNSEEEYLESVAYLRKRLGQAKVSKTAKW